MSQAPRSSPTPLSWKSGTGRARRSPAARRFRRWLATFCALAVFGLFGRMMYLWVQRSPTLRLVCVSAVYRNGSVPPIPFARRDKDLLEHLPCARQVSRAGGSKPPNLQSLVSALKSGSLCDTGDALLVYVAAHGVSVDGRAYLVDTTFDGRTDGLDDPKSTPTSLVELDDLLGALRGCQARLKLLVLDSGHLERDPHLGMLANEFPRLLDEKVGPLDEDPGAGESSDGRRDKRLWIIRSNEPLERSHVSYALRDSLLAYFVAQGLQGAAVVKGGMPDDQIYLDELFSYVKNNVDSWVWAASGRKERQLPVLLHDGEGRDPDLMKRDLFMCRVMDSAKLNPPPVNPETGATPPAADDETSKENAEEEAVGAASKPTKGQATADPVDGTTSGEATADAGTAASTLDDEPWPERLSALRRCWVERRRARDESWSDVDFRPHHWRQLDERLLGCESLAWDDSPGVEIESQTIAEERQLSLAMAPGFTQHRITRVYSLDSGLERAIRLRNDVLDSLPHLVSWLARDRKDRPAARANIEALLDGAQGVPNRLLSLLDRFDEQPPKNPGSWLKQLDDEAKAIEELYDNLRAAFDQAVDDAVTEYEIQDLLTTPLPDPARRRRLLRRLDESPRHDGSPKPTAKVDETSTWERCRRAARYELRLAELQQRGLADCKAKIAAALTHLVSVADRERWSEYHDLGGEIRVLRQRFARGLGEGQRAPPGGPRATETRLRLLDPRQTPELAGDGELRLTQWAFPDPGFAREIVARLERRTDEDAIVVFDWTVQSERRPLPSGLQVQIRLDPQQHAEVFELSAAPGPNAPRAPLSFEEPLRGSRADDGKRLTGTFGLRVKPDQPQRPSEVNFTLRVSGAEQRVSGIQQPAATASFPKPGRLEWHVERRGDPNGADVVSYELPVVARRKGDEFHHRVALFPYPGCKTEFTVGLRNPKGWARKVTCRFFRVKPPDGTDRYATNWWPLEPDDTLRAACIPVGKAVPVEFTSSGPREKPVPSPNPVASTPLESAVRPPAVGPPAIKSTQEDGPDATSGLVCIATDDANEDRYLLWLVPSQVLHPQDYLTPDVHFDSESKQIRITMAQVADHPRRPGGSEIRLRSGEIEKVDRKKPDARPPNLAPDWVRPGATMKADGEFKPGQEKSGRLFIDVGEFNGTARLFLDVDGYPRAFVYLVSCIADDSSGRLEREYARVAIETPREGEAIRHENADPLHVALKVDTPRGFFETSSGDGGAPGVLRVGIRQEPDHELTFHSNRDVKALWVAPNPDDPEASNRLTILTRVTDLSVEFRLAGAVNDTQREAARTIVAELSGAVFERRAATRNVVIDDGPPMIVPVDGLSVEHGNELIFQVRTQDKGMVAKVMVGLKGELKDAQVEAEPVPGDDGVFEVRFPTVELPKPLKPTRHTLRVWAFDRVALKDQDDPHHMTTLDVPFDLEPPREPVAPGKETEIVVYGKVVSSIGNMAPVAGATVTLKNAGKSIKALGPTNDEGLFQVKAKVGVPYDVEVQGTVAGRPIGASRQSPWTIVKSQTDMSNAEKILVKHTGKRGN